MKSVAPASGGKPVEWSKAAISGTVLAVLGFVTLWLVFGLFLSAAAAICGHVARHETADRSPARPAPRHLRALAQLCHDAVLSRSRPRGRADLPAVEQWREGREEQHRAESRNPRLASLRGCEEYARGQPRPVSGLMGGSLGALPPGRRNSRTPAQSLPGRGPRWPSNSSVTTGRARCHRRFRRRHPGDRPPVHSEITVVHANGRVAELHNPDYEAP